VDVSGSGITDFGAISLAAILKGSSLETQPEITAAEK